MTLSTTTTTTITTTTLQDRCLFRYVENQMTINEAKSEGDQYQQQQQ